MHENVGTTGVVGVLSQGEGPVVLARADMDALPLQEQTGLDYASTQTAAGPGGEQVHVMHGCGHDVHVAALISAAQWMSDHRDQWAGTFIALFQPAEEQGAGAQSMVDAGLTELAPRPDIAFAQHVLALPAGQVGVRPGPFYSTAANLRITVHGEGGHGSAPHLTVDPVVLAAAIVGRLQTIVSRELPPGEFAVVTVGQIIAGTQSNIIADRAVMELNLRTYSEETEAQVLAAIDRIVRGECAAAGSPKEPEFEFHDGFPVTVNDDDASERVRVAFAEHFGEDLQPIDRQTASEDFAVIPEAFGTPMSSGGWAAAMPRRLPVARRGPFPRTTPPTSHRSPGRLCRPAPRRSSWPRGPGWPERSGTSVQSVRCGPPVTPGRRRRGMTEVSTARSTEAIGAAAREATVALRVSTPRRASSGPINASRETAAGTGRMNRVIFWILPVGLSSSHWISSRFLPRRRLVPYRA